MSSTPRVSLEEREKPWGSLSSLPTEGKHVQEIPSLSLVLSRSSLSFVSQREEEEEEAIEREKELGMHLKLDMPLLLELLLNALSHFSCMCLYYRVYVSVSIISLTHTWKAKKVQGISVRHVQFSLHSLQASSLSVSSVLTIS